MYVNSELAISSLTVTVNTAAVLNLSQSTVAWPHCHCHRKLRLCIGERMYHMVPQAESQRITKTCCDGVVRDCVASAVRTTRLKQFDRWAMPLIDRALAVSDATRVSRRWAPSYSDQRRTCTTTTPQSLSAAGDDRASLRGAQHAPDAQIAALWPEHDGRTDDISFKLRSFVAMSRRSAVTFVPSHQLKTIPDHSLRHQWSVM